MVSGIRESEKRDVTNASGAMNRGCDDAGTWRATADTLELDSVIGARTNRDMPSDTTILRPPAETRRRAIARLLAEGPQTAYELSTALRMPEKDVAAHLEHLARSLRRSGATLAVEPAHCRDCDYVFRDRTRLTRPSACPRCRGQHLSAPVFRIETRA